MFMRRQQAASLLHIGLGFSLIVTHVCTPKAIVLTSAIITIVDGLSMGIDGKKIGLTLQLRKKFHEMLHGAKNAAGQTTGLYTYKGALCTIAQLAAFEEKIEKLLKDIEKDGQQHNEALKQECLQDQKELISTLKIAKQDFDHKVEPFMVIAAGMKQFIEILIKESCEKRKLHNSFLEKWAEEKEENDRQLFHQEINSFHQLGDFLKDLSLFLKDLVDSCPKGHAQYQELVRLHKEKKDAAEKSTT